VSKVSLSLARDSWSYAVDRVFQRGDGFEQVGALRGQVVGALLRLGQFVERGEVDRAERRDFVLQPRNVGLQLRRPGAVGQGLFELGFVGGGFAQLQFELRLHQHGFLVFQLELFDAAAQRVEPLFAAEARFVMIS